MPATKAASTKPAALTPTKVARTPASVASAPRTGPRRAPKTAAPIVVPITVPRRLGAATATTQASAPAQENALPIPCAKRAIESVQISVAIPKARLAAAVSVVPSSTAHFAPKRDAAIPPGMDAARTPAA